jgi:hypothetical protein
MLKRILAILLCACMTFAFAACDNNTKKPNANASIGNNSDHEHDDGTFPNDNDTAPSDDVIADATANPTDDSTESDDTVEEIEFTYKMAPICRYYDEEDDETELWFVIELDQKIFALGRNTTIVNAKTGEEIKNRDIDCWDGYICQDDHMEKDNWIGARWLHDCAMRTVRVVQEGNITFEDLKVTVESFYYTSESLPSDHESYEIEFNANIAEISTRQKIIHGDVLFEAGGKYYVFDGFGVGGNSEKHYISMSIECIDGTTQELHDLMLNNTTMVYWTPYEEDVDLDKHLKPVAIPSNCEFYINCDKSSIDVGIASKDGRELTDDEKDMVNCSAIKYTSPDGQIVIWIEN